MKFEDRRQAGRLLVQLLRERRVAPEVVLGIARGGVVVAREIAAEFGAEFGALAVRKIAARWNSETAVGAVATGVNAWIDHVRARELRIESDHLVTESDRQQRECARMDAAFGRFGPPRLQGRRVLIVDDALASGATAHAAIRRARSLQAAIVEFAAPVASAAAVASLDEEGVPLHCLLVEPDLSWAGALYDDFRPVDEEEVCRILAEVRCASPVAIRHLTIAREGAALSAILEAPKNAGPHPTVLLVHGSGECKDSAPIVALARQLRERGLATLRFDLSGCGESSPSHEREPLRFMRDLAAVFTWALSAPDLDRRRIAVFGEGLGAWVALCAALDGEIGPAALALCAPPLQRPDLVSLDVPCLLVVGEKDSNVAGVVAAASSGGAATLEIVKGAGHCFTEAGAFEAAAGFVTRWLSERLVGRAKAQV